MLGEPWRVTEAVVGRQRVSNSARDIADISMEDGEAL